jgi:cytosolic carboxypeptidase protein 2/3
VFFVLPMVNIDGVKYGHYRTNMNGVDLNRLWRAPRKEIHPEVYYVKKFLLEVNRVNPISLILDIHGHSKNMNSFFYGNPSPKKDNLNIEDPKIFPYICSKRIK